MRTFENTKLGKLTHVPGAQNPADLGALGMRANKIASTVWPNGPAWLRENEAQWQKATIQRTLVEETSEKTQVVALLPNKPLEIRCQWFGSWTKLFQTICHNLHSKSLDQLRAPIL